MFVWIALYIAGLAVFFGTAGWILPHIFFKNKYSGGDSRDRGIGKYYIPGTGHAIVYKTENKNRKYIEKYILYERGGKKYLSYKIKNGVSYIDFDITLFNKTKTSFLVLNTKSIIDGEPEDIELPYETAYISLSINQANNEKLPYERRVLTNKFIYILYFISMLALSVGFALLTRICFGNIMSGVFSEDFIKNPEETRNVIIYALIIATVMTTATCISIAKKQK